MKSNRRELLDAILEYQFACIELNLYLDNNPNDRKAINAYNSYSNKFMEAKRAYEEKYGPLTNFGYVPSSYSWQWVCNPWPWDNEFYK